MRRFSNTEQGRVRWRVKTKATKRLEALVADPDHVLQGAGSIARRDVGREFVVEGEWALSAEGAKLSDPRAFTLQV